ncbi:hypothetical protein P4T48_17900 [Bacillus paramycoides]|nr:hypothetical protein [Bacillus paramycoides]
MSIIYYPIPGFYHDYDQHHYGNDCSSLHVAFVVLVQLYCHDQ